MSKVIAIARREIAERAFMFVAAIALACAPFLALLVPRETLEARLQVVGSASMIVATAAVVGFSLLLGASVIGRELTEKRLSFYFARPVSGGTIWFGKLVAALAIIVGCEAIAFLPAWLIFRATLDETQVLQPLVLTLLLAVTVFALGHVTSTMLRSRSSLLIADFGGALAFIAVVGVLVAPLSEHAAYVLMAVIVSAIAAVMLIAILVAPAWQLQRGRTDARRSHRELSRFIWTTATVLLVLLTAYTIWLRGAGPRDLTVTSSEYPFGHQDAAGVALGGPMRHQLDYRAAFVIDPETGDYRPVPIGYVWSAVSNGPGTDVIWTDNNVPLVAALSTSFRTMGLIPEWRVNVASKRDRWRPREIASGTGRNGFPTSLAISDDGRTAVIVNGTNATVYDVPGGRIRIAAHIPMKEPGWTTIRFVSADTIRLFALEYRTKTAVVMDLEIAARRTRVVTTMRESSGRSFFVFPVARGQRFIAVWREHSVSGRTVELRLYDASTVRELAVFADPEKPVSVRELRDGRFVGVVDSTGQRELRFYTPDARLLRSIRLSAAKRMSVGTQLPNGQLIVSTSSGRESQPAEWTSYAIDVDRGSIVASARGLDVLNHPWTDAPPRIPVFIDGRGDLVTWDPVTNARRVLLALKR